MKVRIQKSTDYLNNKETFRFKNDKTLYEVVDYIYYKKYKSSDKPKILPNGKMVLTFKTL